MATRHIETGGTKYWFILMLRNKFFWILLISLTLFSSLAFRYKITGTNKGYIYKTDRFTGKTWVVSGDREVKVVDVEDVLPTPTKLPFDVSDLSIVSIKTVGQVAELVILNRSSRNVSYINLKVVYSSEKDGIATDTRYHNVPVTIGASDTVTFYVPLKDSSRRYWYNIYIESAE